MTADLLARARAGDGNASGQLVDPYRRELQVYCYRFLGSVADAEDAPATRRPGASTLSGSWSLTLSGAQISAMTRFDPSTLPRFGLPASVGN